MQDLFIFHRYDPIGTRPLIVRRGVVKMTTSNVTLLSCSSGLQSNRPGSVHGKFRFFFFFVTT